MSLTIVDGAEYLLVRKLAAYSKAKGKSSRSVPFLRGASKPSKFVKGKTGAERAAFVRIDTRANKIVPLTHNRSSWGIAVADLLRFAPELAPAPAPAATPAPAPAATPTEAAAAPAPTEAAAAPTEAAAAPAPTEAAAAPARRPLSIKDLGKPRDRPPALPVLPAIPAATTIQQH